MKRAHRLTPRAALINTGICDRPHYWARVGVVRGAAVAADADDRVLAEVAGVVITRDYNILDNNDSNNAIFASAFSRTSPTRIYGSTDNATDSSLCAPLPLMKSL